MLRKIIAILVLSLVTINPNYAESIDIGGHAGTPKGFYDEIRPEDIENEEQEEQSRIYSTNDDSSLIDDSEDGIIIPPASTKTKATKNYSQIYSDLEVPSFSYLHDIDPEQYYDMKDTTWSVYPLFRLNSPLYFKSITIEPGYYLLTPRQHDGDWFLLFKQNGVVKHIIPVYERNYTPEHFYDEHIAKEKLNGAQKMHMGFLSFIGNFKSTKRKDPVKTYLEINDLENYFVSIIIYYGSHKYSTIFRSIKL